MLAGFRIRLRYAPAFPMMAEDAYLCAIFSIYGLAGPQAGWDGTIPPHHTAMSKEVNGVKIGFRSLAQVGDRNQLQYKHVIVALLETLNAFARKDRFCFTQADMILRDEIIGDIAIGRRMPVLYGVNATLGDISLSSDTMGSGNPTEGGEIVDPEDSDFVMSYEMVGDSIPCKTLLNAALSGMANSAVFSNHDPCRNFGGFSSSGTVTYQFFGKPRGTSTYALTYVMVRTVLELLPKELYEKQKCGEVEFDLIYSGEKVGGGSFSLF